MRFRSVFSRIVDVLVGISLLLLGACVTDRTPKLVRTAPVNFQDSYSQMQFKVLPADEQVRLAINDQDPLFSFEGGLGVYESLALPDLTQPYVLQIDSEVVKRSDNPNGTIFFPVLTFLDAKKNWIKTFDALPYVTQKPIGKKNYITVSLQISDELAAARYVVIHTHKDKLNKAIGYYDGQELMQSSQFNTMMTAPISVPRYRYEFASQGWVRVTAFIPTEGDNDKKPSVEY